MLAAASAIAQEEPGGRTNQPPTGAASDLVPGQIGTSDGERSSGGATKGSDSPKRKLPDYDGRGDPPTTAGDIGLWIPRVILSPLYLVSEYGLRRPIGGGITYAEQHQLPEAIVDFFTFGPDKKAGIVPTALIDFGFKPSVGIYVFWDDLLGKDNHLRLHASTWGKDWNQASVADRVKIGDRSTFDMRVEGVTRPDQIFHGLGPSSLFKDRTRYGLQKVQVHPVFEIQWWRGSRVTVEGGMKHVNFSDENCCGDPSLVSEAAKGKAVLPPGFDTGYTSVYQRGEFTIDTREDRPANQSGVRLELEVEQAANVRQPADTWIRYGGSFGGYVDFRNNRTVSLSGTVLFVDPLAKNAVVPFTEQVVLGGSGPMRGYLYGRLIDRSAAVATLKYRWPIWVFLDGTMQGSVGNVFGSQLDDFAWKLLRFSGAVGVESVGGADHTFELLFGVGSETFDHGTQLNSFRLVFGTNRGF